MYETFFGLTRRPFTAAPQIDQYVPNPHAEQALHTLTRSIERGEGPGLIIGSTGTGKTFLLNMLAARYPYQFRVAYLASARFSSPKALLQAILYELGRPYRGMDEEELRLALSEFLCDGEPDGRPLLLLVDEAHTLSLRLLEEIRMITNLVREGQPLVRLVLAGNARLEERFTSPKLDSLNQRIAARCYLESLGRDDSANYVRKHLERAGGNPDQLLADDAYAAIYTATDGVPRLLNQVCDQALILAAVADRKRLDAACVEEAWADLQQLPTPWNRDPVVRAAPRGDTPGVVEFGSLEGETPTVLSRDLASLAGNNPAQNNPAHDPRENAMENESHFSYDTSLGGDPTLEMDFLQRSLAALEGAECGMDMPPPTLSGETAHDEDDDFQPAGFVGPEVELVFHGAHHPFGESFAEEEVVIDHYASIEKKVAERRVHDRSGQGREIAAVLAERPTVPAGSPASAAQAEAPAAQAQSPAAAEERPTLAVVVAGDDDHPPHDSPIIRQPQPIDLPTITANWESAAGEPVMPDYGHESALVASLEWHDLDTEHGDRLEVSADRLATGDDRDIIIIEEQRNEAAMTLAKPRSQRTRRQEYRQLFARLRKGG